MQKLVIGAVILAASAIGAARADPEGTAVETTGISPTEGPTGFESSYARRPATTNELGTAHLENTFSADDSYQFIWGPSALHAEHRRGSGPFGPLMEVE